MRKLIKFSLYSTVSVFLLIICLFLIITTQPFLKSIVLPIISSSIDAEISSKYVYISLLKGEVELNDFDLVSNDKSYSVKAEKFAGKIKLLDLLENKITISYLELDKAQINVIENIAENIGNESNIVDENNEKEEDKKDSEPLLFDIKDVKINNVNFIYEMIRSKKVDSSILELKNINLLLPKLKTNDKGVVKYSFDIEVIAPNLKEKNAKGNLKGNTEFELNQNSYPIFIESSSVLDMGKSPTPLDFKLKKGKIDSEGRIPFTFYGNIKDLSMLPIFKAFLEGSYSDSRGNVNNITLDISGTDIENIDWTKNLKGDLSIQVEDLEIPSKLLTFKITKLIFLPLYIIANLNKYLTANDVLPSQVTDVLNVSNQVLDGAKEFNFRKGNVDLSINEGCIDVNQFELKGGHGCPIRSMSSTGSVDFYYGLNLRTETNITGIIIPLTIRGSIDDPKPLVNKMLPGLLGKTAENLVRTGAEIGVDFGKRMGKSAGNFIKNIPNIVTDYDE